MSRFSMTLIEANQKILTGKYTGIQQHFPLEMMSNASSPFGVIRSACCRKSLSVGASCCPRRSGGVGRCGAAGSGRSLSRGAHIQTAELIILFEVKEDVDTDDAQIMLDSIWSLQYQLPGALCSFGGKSFRNAWQRGRPLFAFDPPLT